MLGCVGLSLFRLGWVVFGSFWSRYFGLIYDSLRCVLLGYFCMLA
jgi:hypothetical protein